MDIVHEVLAFLRDYANGNQTEDRKQKIAAAYRSVFGESMRLGCSTCYIEALFQIRKFMEKQPCRYRLKPGALLQAFGDESKTCTNMNLTDELAEYHLRTNPGCISLFSVPTSEEIQRMFFAPQRELEIVAPEASEIIDETETVPSKRGRPRR